MPGPHRQRRPPRVWWIPVLAALLVGLSRSGGLNLEQLIAAVLGLFALVALARRPGLALRLMAIVLPFQLVITATLYEVGLGAGLVRMAGLWKELAAAAVIVAAWRTATRHAHRLDALDWCALAFGLLGLVYLLLPELAAGPFGSSLSLDARFLAWRALVLPVVLLVAARHLRLPDDQAARLFNVVAVVGVVVGGLAVFEFMASPLWNRLMVDTLGVNRFRIQVLEVDPTELGGLVDDIRTYGEVAGRSIVRVGGPMASYLQLSFVLLIALGVLLERLVQGRRAPLATAGTALVGAGILFTQTRSAIVGACIVVLAALRPGPGRSTVTRTRFTLLAVLAGVLVVPLVLSAGLADRFTSGDVESDDVHDVRFDAAVDSVTAHPLGTGLATGATGSEGVEGAIIPENQLLDIGVQLGVVGMALILAVVVLLLQRLRAAAARSRTLDGPVRAMGARSALIGLLVPCWYLQPFSTPEVGWVLFALLGAALGSIEHELLDRGGAPAGAVAGGR